MRPGKLTLKASGVLEHWEYAGINEYFQLALEKIERGRGEYGMDYLKRPDASFRRNIEEELADISGWAAMRYCKMRSKTCRE